MNNKKFQSMNQLDRIEYLLEKNENSYSPSILSLPMLFVQVFIFFMIVDIFAGKYGIENYFIIIFPTLIKVMFFLTIISTIIDTIFIIRGFKKNKEINLKYKK